VGPSVELQADADDREPPRPAVQPAGAAVPGGRPLLTLTDLATVRLTRARNVGGMEEHLYDQYNVCVHPAVSLLSMMRRLMQMQQQEVLCNIESHIIRTWL